jgi:Uma2 family endonuclease
MAIQIKTPIYTPDDYLALERTAEYKSEYLNGQIYAMSGGSPEHSRIGANVIAAMTLHLQDKPCGVFTSDMRIRTSPMGLYAYPDLSVVCGEPEFHDEKRDILTNPVLLVEVLSPSTEAFDRGRKFAMYQELESLTDYILVAQDEARVEHYARKSRDHWLLTIARGLESEIYIASLECALHLSQVYAKISL